MLRLYTALIPAADAAAALIARSIPRQPCDPRRVGEDAARRKRWRRHVSPARSSTISPHRIAIFEPSGAMTYFEPQVL